MATNNNGTILKVSLGSMIFLLVIILGFINSTKLDADVYEVQKDWDKSQFIEIRKDLTVINNKIDLLLLNSGISKAQVQKKLKENG